MAVDTYFEQNRHAQRRLAADLVDVDERLMAWGRWARSDETPGALSSMTILGRLIEQGPTGAGQQGGRQSIPEPIARVDAANQQLSPASSGQSCQSDTSTARTYLPSMRKTQHEASTRCGTAFDARRAIQVAIGDSRRNHAGLRLVAPSVQVASWNGDAGQCSRIFRTPHHDEETQRFIRTNFSDRFVPNADWKAIRSRESETTRAAETRVFVALGPAAIPVRYRFSHGGGSEFRCPSHGAFSKWAGAATTCGHASEVRPARGR